MPSFPTVSLAASAFFLCGGSELSREQLDPVPAQANPERWVDEHGDYLYRFALSRVRGPDVAEDLVQETLLAALKTAAAFAGRSSERTWLTGILKNKILDWLRRKQRARLMADLDQPDPCLEDLFDQSGHWKSGPRLWRGDPARILERQEFWDAFRHCHARLPDRLREVFSLRAMDDVPAADVCQVLGITATNLWTLLHRARTRLWRCLDQSGFNPSDAEG
jgi:RNA polymerase sigma-70 factor (TIGR02943 family)